MADEETPKRRGPVRRGEMRDVLGAAATRSTASEGAKAPVNLLSDAEARILSDFLGELKRSTDILTIAVDGIKEAAEAIANVQSGSTGRGRVRSSAEKDSASGGGGRRGGGGGRGTGGDDGGDIFDDGEEEDPSAPSIPMSEPDPRLVKLRERAGIIGSRRAKRAAQIPPFGTMTTQSMLTVGSDFLARKAFETHEDEDGNVSPIFTKGGVGVKRDASGNVTNAIASDAEGAAPALKAGGIMGSLAPRLAGLSGAMGGMAEMIPEGFAAMTVARTVQGFERGIYAPSRTGMQMGYEPSLTGAGTRNTLGGIWDALSESKFGFNPYLGFGDAQAINQEIQRLGYRGDERSQMFSMFAGLQEHTGISAKDAGGMFDQSFRYGGTSIQQFIQTLEQVPAAAQAANMNVSAFTQQLQAVSSEIATRSGLTPAQVSLGVTAASAATGLTPAAVGTLTNNDYLTIMGAAQSGENLGRYLGDAVGRAAYQSGQGVEQMFKTFTGRSLKDLATDQGLQDLVRMQLWTNPQLFAGLNFQQLLQYANDPTRLQRVGATAGLAELQRQTSATNSATGDAMYQGQDVATPGVRQKLNDQITQQLTGAGIDKNVIGQLISQFGTQKDSRGIANEIRLAQRLVGQKTDKAINRANIKSTVEINLNGDAARILKATLKDQKYDTSNPTNNNSGFDWGGAVHETTKAMEYTAGFGGLVPSLVDGIIG